MQALPSPAARFFFVWQPVLPTDVFPAAEAHRRAETDARASHYWDVGLALGKAWAAPLATPYPDVAAGKPLAWDVVMLFDRGVTWGAELPAPALHMFPRDTEAGAPGFSVERLRVELGRRVEG
jgi:hypothetical protein